MKNKNLLIILAITTLIIFVGFLFIKNKNIPKVTPENNIADELNLEIELTNRIQIAEREGVAVDEINKEEGPIFKVFKIGEIKNSIYKNSDIVSVEYNCHDAPCKGIQRFHPDSIFIKTNKELVFLTKINNYSTESVELTDLTAGIWSDGEFKVTADLLGLQLVFDKSHTIPGWEYADKLSVQVGDFNITGDLMYQRQEVDKNNLQIVSNSNPQVYIFKPQKEKTFHYSPIYEFTDGAESEEDFHRDEFLLERPDKSFFAYQYDISASLPSKELAKENTIHYDGKLSVCRFNVNDAFIFDRILDKNKDLTEKGIMNIFNNPKVPYYELKDTNHKILRYFYRDYSILANAGDGKSYMVTTDVNSYDKFLALHPVIFYYDFAGRLVMLIRDDLSPLSGCEPIIYLYPEKEQKTFVSVGSKQGISISSPEMKNGISINVSPEGKITDKDNKTYPYLFWEGALPYFNQQQEGFVVKKENIKEFFREKLSILGANAKETEDFIKAQTPKLMDSPYYFFTFISQELINRLAPLNILPKPDTLIRIFVDYKKLESPILVPEQALEKVDSRQGFSVIEWGMIER